MSSSLVRTVGLVYEPLSPLLPTCPGMVRQMEEDKGRFGASAWASATPRLETLRFLLAKETLQHMRASEMCLNRKKESIRERVRGYLTLTQGI